MPYDFCKPHEKKKIPNFFKNFCILGIKCNDPEATFLEKGMITFWVGS